MTETRSLRERAKELRCLYSIHEILRERAQAPARAFTRVVAAIPSGWQRPGTTGARIEYLGRSTVGPGFSAKGHVVSEPIRVWKSEVGHVEVCDSTDDFGGADACFLPEEAELLRTIATRLGEYLEWKHTELLGGGASAADHWRWRERYVEALAAQLSTERFGVTAMFLGGSTESGDAGPGSDIDLWVLCEGSAEQRRELALWLEGWSLGLAELALQQTGYPFENGILDVHWLEARPEAWRQTELRELALRRPGNGDG